jgi:Domain of unknown function DUF29
MTDASLYDTDFLSWTEEQVAALRALAQRPDLSNAVDWENVIEEIECLGRSEWKGVASQIRNALAHILKGYCDPDSLSRVAWSIKTSNSLREARDDFRNSMREHIDMDTVWGSLSSGHGRVAALRGSSPRAFRGIVPSRWTKFSTRALLTIQPTANYMT